MISRITEAEKDELLKNSKLIIKYRGRGHCGYDLSVIKSALQKGIRRNEQNLVKWSLRETYLYFVMGNKFPSQITAAKAFNTNIINRLYIIAVEDCSPRALMATNECASNLENYTKYGESGPEYLMKAGMYLCQSPSSRVCSHLRQLCGVEGVYYIELNKNDQFTISERFKIIFDENIKYGNKSLKSLRIISAYHSLKIYDQLTLGKPPTSTVKRKKLAPFWEKCFDAVIYLSNNDKYVAQYKRELNYALKWRMRFFASKNHFKEENLLLLSAIDLLIAIAHGPRREFEDIQNNNFFSDECFNWLRDHKSIDPMPRYVMDQHTSKPNPSVSFAMESSQVINGDEKWSPKEWLSMYTAAQKKNKKWESLPKLRVEDIENVIAVYNKSRKAPVIIVKMVDNNFPIAIKHMKKSFGYGAHQNFVQNLKDSGACGFKHLHSMPESGRYRGLMRGNFIIHNDLMTKIDEENVYFVMGCVTQNGRVIDARFSHYRGDDSKINYLEMVHIIAFRLLMGVNDTNHSNILIGEEGKLYSVDENNVGSMTHEMILNTKGCKYLKKLLRGKIIELWMSNNDERLKILDLINNQGQIDGISKETLDKIATNSKGIMAKIIQFLND